MYVCGGVMGNEVLKTEFIKIWELLTNLGFYVSHCISVLSKFFEFSKPYLPVIYQ